MPGIIPVGTEFASRGWILWTVTINGSCRCVYDHGGTRRSNCNYVSIQFNILINTYHLQLHIAYMYSSVFHFVLGFSVLLPWPFSLLSSSSTKWYYIVMLASVDLKANVSWEVAWGAWKGVQVHQAIHPLINLPTYLPILYLSIYLSIYLWNLNLETKTLALASLKRNSQEQDSVDRIRKALEEARRWVRWVQAFEGNECKYDVNRCTATLSQDSERVLLWYRSGADTPCLTRFRQGIFFDDFFRQPFFGKGPGMRRPVKAENKKGAEQWVGWPAGGPGTRCEGSSSMRNRVHQDVQLIYAYNNPSFTPGKTVVSRGGISSNPAIWMVMTDW